ncbi:endo-1,4-beta-xylanase [Jidongwangia harbinensis]|uniref:endo-1,4-beta-xylanase n=1 Tax=Jidongwangia harbinensis TaxID=2878561 RepID=UPI001CD99DE1|nr:endo-1,4-beta-xylanase [Jidongwangia harbinensis]MCA2219183.1 endo-1,4-beta-xylanase [Jidongwangia harbinensis]
MTPTRTRSRRRVAFLSGWSALAVAAAAGVVVTALPSSAAATLGGAAAAAGRTFGAAVSDNLGDAGYVDILDSQFSGITPENEMKWDATEAAPGAFTFDAADVIVDHARERGMAVRGHTLVWHSQLPAYVQAIADPAELRTAVDRHITEVAGHFRGRVEYWDVANEAFLDDGSRRPSVFQTVLGDGYIEDAFRTARSVDPDAKLCYNDFSIEGVNAKSDATFEMVRDFTARGVPIDCVGFQSHFVLGQIPADLQANLQRFADLGVEVQITELDIRMDLPADAAKLAQQAEDYATVVRACLAVAPCSSITVWQVSDRESWVPSTFAGQGAALLFDEDRAAKPALEATIAALGG